MKNCMDCANASKVTDPIRTCKAGFNDVQKAWWDENGKKPRSDVIAELPCYQATQLTKMLDTMLESMEDLRATVDQIYK